MKDSNDYHAGNCHTLLAINSELAPPCKTWDTKKNYKYDYTGYCYGQINGELDPELLAFIEAGFYDIIQDLNGIFWFGTDDGLFKYSPHEEVFIRYADPSTPGDQSYSKVYECFPDQGKSLWLRKVNGLSKFDKVSGIFHLFPFNPDDPKYKYMHLFYTELMDKNGKLWMASDNFGLIRINSYMVE